MVEPAGDPGTGVDDFRPSLISWNLTRMCNLRCPHCYLSAGRRSKDELTTDECLRLLDDMAELGTEMLILTGGEPLLRKDIYDLCRAASGRGFLVVMGTNGVLIDEVVAERLVACGVRGVGISIDSLDPEVHDGFRGGPGSWQHSVRALELCSRLGLEVLIQTTLMEMNLHELPALLDFARDHGARALNLYFLVQTGRGQQLSDLDAVQTESLLGELVTAQEDYRPMMVRSKCAPHFKRIAYERGSLGLESGGCMAGTRYCRITPEGDVTPCPYMDAVAGNVRQQSFSDIWRQAPLLQGLRRPRDLGGRCGSCEFQELCGGCRCRAYAATGDVMAEDPACTYQPTGDPLPLAPAASWSDEAQARLERIPLRFIREKVASGVAAWAESRSIDLITPEVMKQAMASAPMSSMFRPPRRL